jgi:hypothetical protein
MSTLININCDDETSRLLNTNTQTVITHSRCYSYENIKRNKKNILCGLVIFMIWLIWPFVSIPIYYAMDDARTIESTCNMMKCHCESVLNQYKIQTNCYIDLYEINKHYERNNIYISDTTNALCDYMNITQTCYYTYNDPNDTLSLNYFSIGNNHNNVVMFYVLLILIFGSIFWLLLIFFGMGLSYIFYETILKTCK